MMTDPRHPLRHLIPPVSPDDVESAKWHLHHVLDGAVEALLLLDPDVVRWPVLFGGLDRAVEQHSGHTRARRRVRDLVARVREHLDPQHHPDLVELEDHVRTAMTDASEAGFRLGLLVSRSGVKS